jgi:hypothetical protein
MWGLETSWSAGFVMVKVYIAVEIDRTGFEGSLGEVLAQWSVVEDLARVWFLVERFEVFKVGFCVVAWADFFRF